jgi:hypothetical protein
MVNMLAVNYLCFFHSLDCILISFVTFLPPHSYIAESAYTEGIKGKISGPGREMSMICVPSPREMPKTRFSRVPSNLGFFFESTIFIFIQLNQLQS